METNGNKIKRIFKVENLKEFRFFKGVVKTQHTSRRKGGYFKYSNEYDFGTFCTFQGEIFKINSETVTLIVSKTKKLYETKWFEITINEI